MNEQFISDLIKTLDNLIKSLQILSQELQKQSQLIIQLDTQTKELRDKETTHRQKGIGLEKQRQQFLSEKEYLNQRGAEIRKTEETAKRTIEEAQEKQKVISEAKEELEKKRLEIE